MTTRNEKVRLSLEDAGFSTGLAKAAGQAALLERQLDDLDGTTVSVSRDFDGLGNTFRENGSEIDRYSGRLRLLADTALMLGPALVPIGAVGVPALTGLASAFGFTAIGAGSAVVAFNGVGDALEALRKAQVDPTIENLQAASDALDQIGPHAGAFAQELVAMGPAFREVRDAAAAGLFPGLLASLDDVERVLPKVASLFQVVGDAVGDLANRGAESLASAEWADFFSFLEAEAPRALSDLGSALGNVAHAMSELWEGFAPLNRDFTGWLRDSAVAFNEWATGVSQTDGFKEFVDYIRDNGPRVADAMGSIGNALVQVVEAAAPLGGPVLTIVAGLADAIAALAGSNAGPALFGLAAGMAAVSRATKIAGPAMSSLSTAFLDLRTSPNRAATAMERFGGAAKMAAGGAGVALFAHSLTQTNDELRAFEGVVGGAMAGFSVGGGWGAAIGGAVGLMTSLGSSADESSAQVQAFTDALIESKGAIDDTVRTIAATSLEDAGILEHAEKLGLDLELVTDAALGNADAISQVNAVLDQYNQISAAGTGRGGAAISLDETTQSAMLVRDAIAGTNGALDEGIGAARRHAAAMGETGGAARDAAAGMDDAARAALNLSDALAALSGWLDRREALRGWNDSVRELGKSIRNGFSRKDAENIDQVGRSFLQMADALEGKSGQQESFIKGAIQQLNDLARGAGPKAKAAIGELVAQLQKVRAAAEDVNDVRIKPKADLSNDGLIRRTNESKSALEELDRMRPDPKVNVTSNAQQVAAQTNAALNGIDDEYVNIYINRVGSMGRPGQDPMGGVADGGVMPDAPGPYRDMFPMLLAPKERVISNRYGQADTFAPLLQRINNWRPGQGLADGSPEFGSSPRGRDWGSMPLGGLAGLKDDLRETSKALRGLNREVNQSERAMNKQERVLDKATRAYEKQANVVEEWQSKFDDLANTVTGSLTTALGAGLDGDRSPWAGPLDIFGTLMGTLNSDTVRGGAFNQARDTIDDFVEGPALERLLRELSPEQFIQLAGLSGAQLEKIEAAINLRDSVVGGAGSGSADAIYGADLRAAKGELMALRSIVADERDQWKWFRAAWRQDKTELQMAERLQRVQEREIRRLERERDQAEGARRAGQRAGR